VFADAHDDAIHSANQANLLSRECAYSISDDAKFQKKKDIGLSKCKMKNLILSHTKCKELDLQSPKDSSTDMPGIMRKIGMVPNVMWHLWTKGCA
jgi:hypothetical protein